MLEIKNVKKIYKDGSVGLKNVSITLPDTSLVVINGKSGSGKSTLLNLISGIMRPTDGEILYNGKNIKNISNYETLIGNIFQDYNLIRDLNVIDNINLIDNKKTDELMNVLGIADLKKKSISEISGGEARRVAIARSLNKNVSILLCDEPTESLDKDNEESILKILHEISKNILVIIVSHKESTLKYADRVIRISKGEVVSDDLVHDPINQVDNGKMKSKVKFSKLIKIGFKRIINNMGLFSLNLSSLLVAMSLLFISLVLRSIDINKIEISEMVNNGVYKLNIDGHGEKSSKKMKEFAPEINDVYTYILDGDLLKFNFGTVDEEIGAFYISSINMPKVVHIRDGLFLRSDEIIGSIPEYENEILISEYTFEGIKKFGIKNEYSEFIKYESIEDIVGVNVIYGGKIVKITGVLKQDMGDFQGLKNITFVQTHKQKNYFSMFNNSVVEMNYVYVTEKFDEFIGYRDKYVDHFYLNTNDENLLYKVKKKYNSEDMLATSIYSSILGEYTNLISKLKNIGGVLLIVAFIFASVMLFNYFTNSIENNEKDNKILKYLGVSNIGIFVPYLFSLLVLMVLSIIGGMCIFKIVANTLNEFYYNILSNQINIFEISFDHIIRLLIVFAIIIFILSLISLVKINKTIKRYTD